MYRKIYLFLFLLIGYVNANAQLVINEISQGGSGTQEYVEFVVVGTRTCADTTEDLRNWVFDDHNGWFSATTGTGIAQGHMRFANVSNWANVPIGSIILIYNDGDKNTSITMANDPTDANGDRVYIVPASSNLLEQQSSVPASPSSTTFVYPTTGYTTGGSWSRIGLANSGDAIITVAPGNLSTYYHAVAFGVSAFSGVAPIYLSASGNVNYYLTNGSYNAASAWTTGSVPTNETPGTPNTTGNATWINGLLGGGGSGGAITTAINAAICQGKSYTFNGIQRSTAGTYTATFKAVNGCDSIVTLTLTVNPVPVATINTTNVKCLGNTDGTATAVVTGGTAPYTYTWNTVPPKSTPTVTGLAIGSISVIVTDNKGCSDTETVSIVQDPQAAIIISKDTTICEGASALLVASGAKTYTWSPVSTLSCTTCATPIASPKNTTLYTLLTEDNNGCKDTNTVNVTVINKGITSVGTDVTICKGSNTTLTASGGQSYLWEPASSLSNATIANPTATPDSTTRYKVVIKQNDCFTDTLYQTVRVEPLPTVEAGPDFSGFAGTEVEIKATATGAVKYLWVPSNGLSCDDCLNPKLLLTNTETYTILVTSAAGCTATDRITVRITCDGSAVFIPNTFSPNGDGENDYFFPQGKGLGTVKKMLIMNSWGQVMYQKTNLNANTPSDGWDGTYQGRQLPPDVFVYVVEIACAAGEKILLTGDIALIR